MAELWLEFNPSAYLTDTQLSRLKRIPEQYKQGATVTIRTKDGRTFSNTVYAPKGAGVRGIDWADVDAKYRTLVPRAQLSDRQVEASLQVIHDFRHVTHVSALTDLLHAPMSPLPLGEG